MYSLAQKEKNPVLKNSLLFAVPLRVVSAFDFTSDKGFAAMNFSNGLENVYLTSLHKRKALKAPDLYSETPKTRKIAKLPYPDTSSSELAIVYNKFSGEKITSLKKKGKKFNVNLKKFIMESKSEDANNILEKIAKKYDNVLGKKVFDSYDNKQGSVYKAVLSATSDNDIELSKFLLKNLNKPLLGKNSKTINDLIKDRYGEMEKADLKQRIEYDFDFSSIAFDDANNYIREKVVNNSIVEFLEEKNSKNN